MWGKCGKIIEVPLVIGAGMVCVYLKHFHKWSSLGHFRSWSGDNILPMVLDIDDV